ncbi:MAG: RNA-binding protein [Nitrospinae bacterium]|nr:RNA-binding protein [Nitrospinota bacterium]
MATGPQGQKRPGDVVGCAVNVAQIAVGEIEETQTAGQILGRSGGHARAKNLSPERRKEIAQKAAMTRWNNKSTK